MGTTVAVVLAAGKGSRMSSDLPKVLHPLGGEPMVVRPIRAARAAGADPVIVVVGYRAQLVRAAVANAFPAESVRFAEQHEQRGTGHAVLCAFDALAGAEGSVLIINGDVPLLTAETLGQLDASCRASPAGLALVTFEPESAEGYGRIVRDDHGRMLAIVEHRDATAEQRELTECNAGVYCVDGARLREELPQLDADNAQGEVYLTDLVERLAARGEVGTVRVPVTEVAGVNTDAQLQALERLLAGR